VCIVGSSHILALCVINHSVARVIGRYISAHIAESVHTAVAYVISHLVARVF